MIEQIVNYTILAAFVSLMFVMIVSFLGGSYLLLRELWRQ